MRLCIKTFFFFFSLLCECLFLKKLIGESKILYLNFVILLINNFRKVLIITLRRNRKKLRDVLKTLV